MPHVHLPADHSNADVVLAANVAATVNSAELYVAWTHDSGAGAVPEVAARLNEPGREPAQAGPFVELFVALAAGFVAIWHAFAGTPRDTRPMPRPRSGRRTAGETA
jgi:hypothetical protein